jgi:hypothetical protein
MRLFICITFLASITVVSTAEDKKRETVRTIDVSIPGQAKGKATDPTVIATAEELAKVIGDDDAVAVVKKSVDFKKEKVLYFGWAGSGQDKIAFTVEEGKKGVEVSFTFTRGRTRDLRQHKKVFALPKDATFKVVAGGG